MATVSGWEYPYSTKRWQQEIASGIENQSSSLTSKLDESIQLQREVVDSLQRIDVTLQFIHEELGNLHSTVREGVELQKLALERQILQDKLEEFVYQLQKNADEVSHPECGLPLQKQYLISNGLLQTIKELGISTGLIKGISTKTLFESSSLQLAKRKAELLEVSTVRTWVQLWEDEQARATEQSKQTTELEKCARQLNQAKSAQAANQKEIAALKEQQSLLASPLKYWWSLPMIRRLNWFLFYYTTPVLLKKERAKVETALKQTQSSGVNLESVVLQRTEELSACTSALSVADQAYIITKRRREDFEEENKSGLNTKRNG